MAFRCDHPFSAANKVKVGQGRFGCRICRQAGRARRAKSIAGTTRAAVERKARAQPATLRKFSWEQVPQ